MTTADMRRRLNEARASFNRGREIQACLMLLELLVDIEIAKQVSMSQPSKLGDDK